MRAKVGGHRHDGPVRAVACGRPDPVDTVWIRPPWLPVPDSLRSRVASTLAAADQPEASSPDGMAMHAIERVRHLENGCTTSQALVCFDALAPVGVEEMLGAWRGREVPTGHPLGGLLERFGWHGKRFDGPEDAHPLVFAARDGSVFAVNPAILPVHLAVRRPALARAPLVPQIFSRVAPALRTTAPRARLRMTEYRGVLSATMVYDALPLLDVFRRVDADTRLGVMDLRGVAVPLVFVLRRE